MKVIVEQFVTGMRGRVEALPGVTSVVYLPSEAITAAAVADADAIIVRTRTRCDASLLAGSRVRLVGTATIGMDHIDRDWCRRAGIRTVSAPGCNAPAVNQYVWQALHEVIGDDPQGRTLGIVGVGNVGRLVEAEAERRGWRVLRNDPPRAAAEGPEGFVDLDTIAREADVITVHTPLDATTRHLLDAAFFGRLERRPVVINAARGGIVDEEALKDALRSGAVSHAVIDCWKGEPGAIDRELMGLADIATPHIAGYSLEGKRRAADAMLRALAGEEPLAPLRSCPPPSPFDIRALDAALRARPDALDELRNSYELRPE